MNARNKIITGLMLFGLIFLFPLSGWAAIPQTAEEHLAMAQSYVAKAQVEEKIIAEHQKMKADYKEEISKGSPKLRNFYSGKIESMNAHCDAIIQRERQLVREFRNFAEWHRMRAAELEGK